MFDLLSFPPVGWHSYVNLFAHILHSILRSPFPLCHHPVPTMSSSTHFSDPSSFQQQSNEFISWLESYPGVKANPKILLADLRSSGAGRGVGKLTTKPPPPTTQNPHPEQPKQIHERNISLTKTHSYMHSCSRKHCRRRRTIFHSPLPHPRRPKLRPEESATARCRGARSVVVLDVSHAL